MGIVGAAAVAGIAEHIAPQEGRLRGAVRLLSALCILCLVITPAKGVLEALPDLFADLSEIGEGEAASRSEYEAILEGQIRETVQDELCLAVEKELAARFSVTRCEVGVMLTRADGELRVEKVVVTLLGNDIFKNPHAIEDYFSNLLSCPCIVTVGG